MRSRLQYLIAGVVAGSLIVPFAAQAAPNDLDRSFGTGGVTLDRAALVGLGEEGTGLMDLAVLPDGSAVTRAGMRCAMGCRALVVSRYSTSGAPAGRTHHLWMDDDENVHALLVGSVVAPDGALRLTYRSWSVPHVPAGAELVSVSPDGASSSIVPLETAAVPAALDASGSLLAVVRPRPRLVRVDPAGSIDRSFGSRGEVTIPVALPSVAGVSAGRTIRLAGGDRRGVVLLRLSRSGTVLGPPTRVAVPGWQRGRLHDVVGIASGAGPLPWPVRARPGTLAVGRGGHTVVTGTVRRHDARGVLTGRGAFVAFRPDGRVNRSFGTRGVVLLPQSDLMAAVQRNGKVIVAGTAVMIGPANGPAPLVVRRFNADGSLDPSFPLTRIPVDGHATSAVSVGLDGREGIVVAAEAIRDDGDHGLLLARLRGGEAPALRLSSPKRPRLNLARVVATSSVAGRARITVRQSGRVVGAKSVRFTRGSQKAVTVPLRGTSAAGVLSVSGSLKGAPATGVTTVSVR